MSDVAATIQDPDRLAALRRLVLLDTGSTDNDVAAIPAWTWHQLTTTGHELVVFRMTDRPIHDAFGLYRAEATDTSAHPPDPSSPGGR